MLYICKLNWNASTDIHMHRMHIFLNNVPMNSMTCDMHWMLFSFPSFFLFFHILLLLFSFVSFFTSLHKKNELPFLCKNVANFVWKILWFYSSILKSKSYSFSLYKFIFKYFQISFSFMIIFLLAFICNIVPFLFQNFYHFLTSLRNFSLFSNHKFLFFILNYCAVFHSF